MNAPLRHRAVRQAALVDPVRVFVARAEARASLWFNGELLLHDAVDELWASAIRDGLVAKLGPDEVQRLLADAFAPLRTDLPRDEDVDADDPWDDPGWSEAAREYHKARGKDISEVSYPPDELARLRALMADDVSIERVYAEAKERRPGAATATLQAAEYLIKLGDFDLWKEWFDARTKQERAAIVQHLEQRKRTRGT